jgi:isopenicillin N synthase-like dioxygenase
VIPILDGDSLRGDQLAATLTETGAFQLQLHGDRAARLDRVLAASRDFFALASDEKMQIAIERSPHHRGYSVMHNARDFREQLHFGSEDPEPRSDGAPWLQLLGPNLWPRALGDEWRAILLDHLDATARLGREILTALAKAWDLPAHALSPAAPYLIMKSICYHPQPLSSENRPGVAAHVDYSLITLLLQDDVSGLELLLRDGRWHPVPPRSGTLLVNAGEILAHLTGNRVRATPHRVLNPSRERSRISLPVFVNPGLDARVAPILPSLPPIEDPEHIHRVLGKNQLDPFHFGEGEWRRKGENLWCAECCRPG